MSVRKKLKAFRTRRLIGPVGAASLALSPIPRGGAEPARSLAWGPPSLRAPADLSPDVADAARDCRRFVRFFVRELGRQWRGTGLPRSGSGRAAAGHISAPPRWTRSQAGASASASSLLLSRLTFPRHKVVRPRSPEQIRFPVCASPARVWSHQQRLGLAERSPRAVRTRCQGRTVVLGSALMQRW